MNKTSSGGRVVPLRPDGHDNAAAVALRWIEDRHRKGWARAVGELLEEWNDGEALDANGPLDEEALQLIEINLCEWLLARGHMHARGELRNINEHLLGRDGPPLTPAQQRWLAQMRERALRLYRVTDVRPGEGLTLVDELDPSVDPIVVREISGSRTAVPGMLFGARIMQAGEPPLVHFELSGATYPFSRLAEAAVLQDVREEADGARALSLHADIVRDLGEMAIARHWLAQWTAPPALPTIVDAGSGDPLLLVTDHYRVRDAEGLADALAAQPDVSGDARSGWHRMADAGGETRRILVAINPGRSRDRIEVFYRTQAHADAGRAWFDTIAGAAVTHLTREIVDPASPAAVGAGGSVGSRPETPLSRDELAQAVDQIMRGHYANWCDEPVPALGNLTPRAAITTPAGLERVKGLLREYEAGEQESSARQDREPFSFQFLWDGLGLER